MRSRDPLASRVADLARWRRTGGEVTSSTCRSSRRSTLRSPAGRAPYPLPLEPNTAWEDGPRAVLWLGPDEWLMLGRRTSAADRVRARGRARRRAPSGVDVGANRVALEIGGPGRFEVLARGCPIDLHPGRGPTECAQTLFAKPGHPAGASRDHRHPRRQSFADYLIDRLTAGLA